MKRTGNLPPWVVEAGMPTFFHPAQMPKPLSGLRLRPQRLENRVIRLGNQTNERRIGGLLRLENRVIRPGNQTGLVGCVVTGVLENRVIRLGNKTSPSAAPKQRSSATGRSVAANKPLHQPASPAHSAKLDGKKNGR